MSAKPLVVITGASSGIGAEAARMFSAAGHPLLLLARRLEPMTRLALPDTMVRSADVTDAAAVTAAIAEAEARYGHTDLLINNAGMMALSPLATESVATIQSMFDINCVAMLTVSQVVLLGMKSRRGGTIINIGSTAGKQVYDDHTVYNATKYAVHALTEGLRREYSGDNVRIILVAPGMVETELLGNTPAGDILSDYLSYRDAIGGGLSPDAIGSAMLYAYQLPQHVCIREIVVAPTAQKA